MSTLVSQAEALMARQTERQLTDYLRAMATTQQMPETDRWLYSVWENQTDWQLLQHILSGHNRQQPALSLPVLLGCLICTRRPDIEDEQARMLARQQELVHQQTADAIGQHRMGLLTGGGAGLHYTVLTANQSEKAQHWSRLLLTQSEVLNGHTNDLSLGTGQTGWVLIIIRALKMSFERRIVFDVSHLASIVNRYVDYLMAHQLPINAGLENYSFFPTAIAQTEWEVTETESWAAGDIGQLILLYEAGRLIERPDRIEWADRLSGYLIQRRVLNRIQNDQLGLTDGMAGLSLMYRRLYLLTNRSDFLAEGHYWLEQLLNRVRAGDYGPDQSLQTGTLGIYGAIRQWLGKDAGLDLLFL